MAPNREFETLEDGVPSAAPRPGPPSSGANGRSLLEFAATDAGGHDVRFS